MNSDLQSAVFEIEFVALPKGPLEFECHNVEYLDGVIADAARHLAAYTQFGLKGLSTETVFWDSSVDLTACLCQANDALTAARNPVVTAFEIDFFEQGAEFFLCFERVGRGWRYLVREHEVVSSGEGCFDREAFIEGEALVSNLTHLVRIFSERAVETFPALRNVATFTSWRDSAN